MTEKGQSGAVTPVLRQSQEPPKGQIRHHCGQEQCKDKSSNTGGWHLLNLVMLPLSLVLDLLILLVVVLIRIYLKQRGGCSLP